MRARLPKPSGAEWPVWALAVPMTASPPLARLTDAEEARGIRDCTHSTCPSHRRLRRGCPDRGFR